MNYSVIDSNGASIITLTKNECNYSKLDKKHNKNNLINARRNIYTLLDR